MRSDLISKDLQYVWHPFTPQKNSPEPLVITNAEGVYLYDENGKSYIDAISSWWVNLHGHAHLYIAEKIYEQAKKLEQVIFAGFTHEPAINLAERLIKILPGDLSKIFYSDNGSTAVEVAIKMAVQYWWNEKYELRSTKYGSQSPVASRQSVPKVLGSSRQSVTRNKILALNNGYHGDTFGAMSVSDRGVFTLAFHDKLFEVIFLDPPTPHLPLTTSHLPLNEIACFIYEPLVQGAGGMRMYNAESLNALLKFLKEHDIICIADEVMTGFGRTGKMFASEYMNETPDIICLSKGLTGGTMALGVTACTKKIHDAFVDEDRLKTFFHGHSFTANPLACTAALASLDLLAKEECISAIRMISKQHREFAGIVASPQSSVPSPSFTEASPKVGPVSNKIKNIRQLGTILAFDIMDGKDEYLNTISTVISQKALEQGVYIRPLGNTVYIMPPYCITKKQLLRVYDAVLGII